MPRDTIDRQAPSPSGRAAQRSPASARWTGIDPVQPVRESSRRLTIRRSILVGAAVAALTLTPALAHAAPAKHRTVPQVYVGAAACLTGLGWTVERDPGKRWLNAYTPRVVDPGGAQPNATAYLYQRGEGYPGARVVQWSLFTYALTYQEGRDVRACLKRAR